MKRKAVARRPISTTIRLDPGDLHGMTLQARSEWPRESCGIIVSRAPFGPKLPDRIIFSAANVIDELHREEPQRWPPPTEGYVLDPAPLRTALHWFRRGWVLGAVWHSHTNGAPNFSPKDQVLAHAARRHPLFRNTVYLVVGLPRRAAEPTITAWSWDGTLYVKRRVKTSGV